MRKHILVWTILSVMVLSGCSIGDTVEKRLSDTLTEIHTAEQDYRDVQSDLYKIEQKEQEQFESIMKLTQKQKDELESGVAELKKLQDERSSLIEDEVASMKKAKDLAESFDVDIKKADEETINAIQTLKTATIERYDLHSVLISEYKKLQDHQNNLYDLLVNEETELPELKDEVDKVNIQNEKVKSAINAFNESTKEVNTLKEELFSSFEDEK
ncbi:YkyA family protein [Sporosarcina siberiensis]|uniref:YkyA family protein n=1 Tax=Sporosarcina siberiensis TaxID=1365606 RepID=A0ABW4SKR0_9BACL